MWHSCFKTVKFVMQGEGDKKTGYTAKGAARNIFLTCKYCDYVNIGTTQRYYIFLYRQNFKF